MNPVIGSNEPIVRFRRFRNKFSNQELRSLDENLNVPSLPLTIPHTWVSLNRNDSLMNMISFYILLVVTTTYVCPFILSFYSLSLFLSLSLSLFSVWLTFHLRIRSNKHTFADVPPVDTFQTNILTSPLRK